MSYVMSSETGKKHFHAFPIEEEGLKLRTRKSLKPRQNSKNRAEQEKLALGSESSKYPGKSRDDRDLHSSGFRRQDTYSRATHLKSSQNPKSQRAKGDSIENDELVKHMTHLPGYLQRAARVETLQEKALSIGVLDWSWLEDFTQKSEVLNAMSLPPTDEISMVAMDCHEKISKMNKLSSRRYRGTAPTKSMHHNAVSEMGTSLSDFRRFVSVMEKSTVEDEEITKSNENVVKQHCSSKQSSVVIFPNARGDNSSLKISQQCDHMKMSSENMTEIRRNCFSGADNEVFNSADLMRERRTTDKIPKCWDQAQRSENKLPEGEILKKNILNDSHSVPKGLSKCERLQPVDQEFKDLLAQRGLPNQISNLNGLRRSFSHKERTTASTIVSVRSNSMTTDDLILIKDKKSISAKSRFVSLKRLFDPIFKYKPVTSNICIEDAKSHPNSLISRSILCDESFPLNKGLTFKALLQLTRVKGGSLMKFMVDNDRQFLVCSTKYITFQGNFEGRFTFYSLDNCREKGGSWVSQGCKSHVGNFACTEIGQMWVNHSKNSGERSLDREHVLFSSEMRNSRNENKYCNSRIQAEAVAIVSKIPIHARGKYRHENKYTGLVEGILPGKECYGKGTMTVILPGAIHSLTNDGGPSSLISRWRSGGSCDCGGWDVGCKLNVLTNKKISEKLPTTLDGCSTSMPLELIQQEESDSSRPMLSLNQEKRGIYSVKFNSHISSLQAFAICVAFICSQNSSKPLDSSHWTGETDPEELSSVRNSEIKHPSKSKVKDPGKLSQPKPLS